MKRWALGALVTLGGCWNPPDVGLVDEVPIVAEEPTCAEPRQEYVACVLDGDTFDVGDCGSEFGERIRMLGINAPEIAHEANAAECFSDQAWDELARLIDDRTVVLSFDEECLGFYGRTLAYVWVPASDAEDVLGEDAAIEGQSLFVNEYLLANGLVRLYDEDFGDDLRLSARLIAAEQEARVRGLGLWSACVAEEG